MRPDKDAVEHKFLLDVVTHKELDQLGPDFVFLEGGVLVGDQWRIPEEDIERLVTGGAVVVICDVDWNSLNRDRRQYERVLEFCRVSVAYEGIEPVKLYDPRNNYRSEHAIVCNSQDIAYEPWLEPVYNGLPKFVVSLPVPMRSWVELIATCNRSTTRAESYIGGMFSGGEPESGAFASMCRFGLGYLVLITGNVSDDVWMDAFPGNLEWLTRLANHLVERVRIDRRRNIMAQQVFVSHRHRNKDFAHSFRDELRRRGFGSWLDSRKLIAGDDLTPEIRHAIEESTHFALLWSRDCLDAPWIRLELNHALAAGKRIFVIRLDETAVPSEVADKLRVEAMACKASEAAKTVALFIEREERLEI
ncbi:MAG: toll/interleukin-1 receptor domain-containing protein [Nitrospirales bacterium]|nr:toll/interleukin-1 receptor domain-containing protein [Nitrospirales bacterium]